MISSPVNTHYSNQPSVGESEVVSVLLQLGSVTPLISSSGIEVSLLLNVLRFFIALEGL